MTETSPAARSVIVAGLTAFALAVSATAMLLTPVFAASGAKDAANADEGTTVPVMSPVSGSYDPDEVLAAGSTVSYGGWDVTVGDLAWGQNEAVWAATRFPDIALTGDIYEWVTAPITVTNTTDENASFSDVDVMLGTMSHRWHHTLPERQRLPDEFDPGLVHPGETRVGTIGWVQLTEDADDECAYRIDFGGERSYQVRCAPGGVETAAR